MTNAPRKALLLIFFSASLIVGGVAVFNARVDPICFRCETLEDKPWSVNAYYRMAKNIAAFPLTQLLVVGTSRGYVYSVPWLETHTGQATLNASEGGAEVFAKLAFLRVASERTRLATVLWVTDYFEFLEGLGNVKFLSSPALAKFLASDLRPSALSSLRDRAIAYIDHNTLEASFVMRRPHTFAPTRGGPDSMHCESRAPEPMGADLARQVDVAYRTYAESILQRPASADAWAAFQGEFKALQEKGVRVVMLVAPYHPIFRERMKRQFPALWKKHYEWIERLKSFESELVEVANYFDGFPGDDGPGRQNWRDGDHYSCQAATAMLERIRW